jgi:hypothetical protein
VRRFKTIRRRVPEDLRGAAFDIMVRDGGAALAGASRHRPTANAVAGDSDAANDSCASTEALGWSVASHDGQDSVVDAA